MAREHQHHNNKAGIGNIKRHNLQAIKRAYSQQQQNEVETNNISGNSSLAATAAAIATVNNLTTTIQRVISPAHPLVRFIYSI